MIQNDLRDILDGLRTKPFVKGNKPVQNFYPSSASVKYTKNGKTITEGECLRKTWYAWKNYDEHIDTSPSPRISRIWEVGDLLGDMFVKELKEAGLWIGDEVQFYIPELQVSGRIDALIKDPHKAPKPPLRPTPEQIMGVEFKTVGGWFGCKGPIVKTRDTPLSPKPEHVLQCLVYLSYFRKWGIDKWILLYIDRAMGSSESNPKHWNCHTLSIDENDHPVISNDSGTVTWDHMTVDSVLDRYRQAKKYIQANELPPRDYEIQYDNEKIISMYQEDELSKTDVTAVNAYLKRHNKKTTEVNSDDLPILKKGDWRCSYCEFKEICYSDNPDKKPCPPAPETATVETIEDEDNDLKAPALEKLMEGIA